MVEQELVMLRYFLAFSWFCSLSPFFCNLCLKNGYPVHLTSRQTQPRQPLVVAHFFLVPRPRPLPRPRPASDFTCGSTESANGHLTTKQRLKDSGNQSGYIVLIYHIIIYIYIHPKKIRHPISTLSIAINQAISILGGLGKTLGIVHQQSVQGNAIREDDIPWLSLAGAFLDLFRKGNLWISIVMFVYWRLTWGVGRQCSSTRTNCHSESQCLIRVWSRKIRKSAGFSWIELANCTFFEAKKWWLWNQKEVKMLQDSSHDGDPRNFSHPTSAIWALPAARCYLGWSGDPWKPEVCPSRWTWCSSCARSSTYPHLGVQEARGCRTEVRHMVTGEFTGMSCTLTKVSIIS